MMRLQILSDEVSESFLDAVVAAVSVAVEELELLTVTFPRNRRKTLTTFLVLEVMEWGYISAKQVL